MHAQPASCVTSRLLLEVQEPRSARERSMTHRSTTNTVLSKAFIVAHLPTKLPSCSVAAEHWRPTPQSQARRWGGSVSVSSDKSYAQSARRSSETARQALEARRASEPLPMLGVPILIFLRRSSASRACCSLPGQSPPCQAWRILLPCCPWAVQAPVMVLGRRAALSKLPVR